MYFSFILLAERLTDVVDRLKGLEAADLSFADKCQGQFSIFTITLSI